MITFTTSLSRPNIFTLIISHECLSQPKYNFEKHVLLATTAKALKNYPFVWWDMANAGHSICMEDGKNLAFLVLSFIWVPLTKYRLSGLVASAFTTDLSHWTRGRFFSIAVAFSAYRLHSMVLCFYPLMLYLVAISYLSQSSKLQSPCKQKIWHSGSLHDLQAEHKQWMKYTWALGWIN